MKLNKNVFLKKKFKATLGRKKLEEGKIELQPPKPSHSVQKKSSGNGKDGKDRGRKNKNLVEKSSKSKCQVQQLIGFSWNGFA